MVKQSTLRKILGQGNRTREQAAYREDIVTKERFYSNKSTSLQANSFITGLLLFLCYYVFHAS